MSNPQIMFFTDPHIGKVLVSNTTPASRKKLTQQLFEVPMTEIKAHQSKRLPGVVICGGDLFDKFDNPASVVRDGAKIASRCELVLGGNHDVENSIDSYSSLGLVADLTNNVVMPVYNNTTLYAKEVAGIFITAVPHHSTQQLFDQTLSKLCEVKELEGQTILLLHCNYNCDMATNDTSLNLTRDVAAKLLTKFDYIFIGHDHNPKKDFDDRLIVMGSVFPTCFGDCHVDHKVYFIAEDDDFVTEKVVWRADERYLEVEVSAILNDPTTLPQVDFVRVIGHMLPEEAPEVAKWVKAMWKQEVPPFAIRIDANVVASKQEIIEESAGARLSFKDRIEQQLVNSPDLLEVWKSVTGEEESI